jgi:hypothetical protein
MDNISYGRSGEGGSGRREYYATGGEDTERGKRGCAGTPVWANPIRGIDIHE